MSAKHQELYVMSDRAAWNHFGFHRRNGYINVYTNKMGGVRYTYHDKSKQSLKDRKRFPGWFCYRIRIGPNSKFRPDAVWNVGFNNPPIYNEKPHRNIAG